MESSLLWTSSLPNGELRLVPPENSYPSMVSYSAPGSAQVHNRNTYESGDAHGSGDDIGRGKRVRIGPLPIAVWAKVMDTSKGRDKVLVSLSHHVVSMSTD